MKQIQLTRGKFALVDDEDYDRLVAMGKWHVCAGYASKAGKKSQGQQGMCIYMHRFIMSAQKGVEIDHINGDRLDNRKCNLRLCSHLENLKNQPTARKNNTSGFKGVCWNKVLNKWQSNIMLNGKSTHLGVFMCKIEAAKAYNAAAVQFHGEFANINQL